MTTIRSYHSFIAAMLLLLPGSLFSQSSLNALNFDGNSDLVSAAVPALFNDLSTSDFTLEAWVRPSATGFSRILFIQASENSFTSLCTGSPNNIFFYAIENGVTYSVGTYTYLPLNTWTHVAARWITATNELKVFFNGVPQAGFSGGGSTTGTANNLSIGSQPGGGQYFTGSIDEVRVWNTARTNCEILINYRHTLSGTEQDLITYYDFNRGTAGANNAGITNLPDLAGGNDGSLASFALNGANSNWVASGAVINGTGDADAFMTAVDETSCTSYFWPQTGETYSASGAYSDTLTTAQGCDSVVTLNLTIDNNVNTLTTLSGGTITAVAVADAYQWINCATNTIILGATGSSFTPVFNGSYGVVVTDNGCSDTSSCTVISAVGLEEEQTAGLGLLPNPATGLFSLHFEGEAVSLTIADIHGKTVYTKSSLVSGEQTDLSAFENGVYLVAVRTKDGIVVKRLVKN